MTMQIICACAILFFSACNWVEELSKPDDHPTRFSAVKAILNFVVMVACAMWLANKLGELLAHLQVIWK